MVMAFFIEYSQDAIGFDPDSCLLKSLFFSNFPWCIANITPAPGEGPAAINPFPDHQYLILVIKDHTTDIHLGCPVTVILRCGNIDSFDGLTGYPGDHFGRDLLQI